MEMFLLAQMIVSEFAEQSGDQHKIHQFHSRSREEISSFSLEEFAQGVRTHMPLTYQLFLILSGLSEGEEFQAVTFLFS